MHCIAVHCRVQHTTMRTGNQPARTKWIIRTIDKHKNGQNFQCFALKVVGEQLTSGQQETASCYQNHQPVNARIKKERKNNKNTTCPRIMFLAGQPKRWSQLEEIAHADTFTKGGAVCNHCIQPQDPNSSPKLCPGEEERSQPKAEGSLHFSEWLSETEHRKPQNAPLETSPGTYSHVAESWYLMEIVLHRLLEQGGNKKIQQLLHLKLLHPCAWQLSIKQVFLRLCVDKMLSCSDSHEQKLLSCIQSISHDIQGVWNRRQAK